MDDLVKKIKRLLAVIGDRPESKYGNVKVLQEFAANKPPAYYAGLEDDVAELEELLVEHGPAGEDAEHRGRRKALLGVLKWLDEVEEEGELKIEEYVSDMLLNGVLEPQTGAGLLEAAEVGLGIAKAYRCLCRRHNGSLPAGLNESILKMEATIRRAKGE